MSSSVLTPVRRGALGALLAATLLLSACSNDDGGAQTSAPVADTTGSSAAAPASEGGSSGSAGTEMSTTSESPSSRPPKPTPSTPKPSGTGVVGAFSPADTAWFGAMCSGLADKPREQFSSLTGDTQARSAGAAKLLTDQADRLDKAVGDLKGKPAPKVEDGDKLAAAVLAAFPKTAEAARSGAKQVAAAGSDDELQGAFDKALDAMNEANAPLADFNEMMGAPAMVDQLKNVPSCAPLVN